MNEYAFVSSGPPSCSASFNNLVTNWESLQKTLSRSNKFTRALRTLLILIILALHTQQLHAADQNAPLTITALPHTSDFAVCAVVKDRPEYVIEWLEYHLALGVQKIYLFDTDNPDHEDLKQTLQKYIDMNRLELYSLPRVTPRTVPMLQLRIYDICLQNLRTAHKFIGFWDVDEFLVPIDPTIHFPDILLTEFEHKGGLVVNWRYMGPSGHVARPPGGVLKNYIKCLEPDTEYHYTIKSIVNTRYAQHPTTDPHSFFYENENLPTDIDGEEVEGPWSDSPNVDRLALFHYAVKSLEDFRDKMKRGSAMGNRRDEGFFNSIAEYSNSTCPEALELCRSWGLSWCMEDGGGNNGGRKRTEMRKLKLVSV